MSFLFVCETSHVATLVAALVSSTEGANDGGEGEGGSGIGQANRCGNGFGVGPEAGFQLPQIPLAVEHFERAGVLLDNRPQFGVFSLVVARAGA